jgi:hypothetical protein
LSSENKRKSSPPNIAQIKQEPVDEGEVCDNRVIRLESSSDNQELVQVEIEEEYKAVPVASQENEIKEEIIE